MADLIDAVEVDWPFNVFSSEMTTRCNRCLGWVDPSTELFKNDMLVVVCRQCAWRHVRKDHPDAIRKVCSEACSRPDLVSAVVAAAGGEHRVGQMMTRHHSVGHATWCGDGTLVVVYPPKSATAGGWFEVFESWDCTELKRRQWRFVEDP